MSLDGYSGLREKHIVIIGAASLLGYQYAKTLAELGVDIDIIDEKSARLQSLRAEIHANYPQSDCTMISIDNSNNQAIHEYIESLDESISVDTEIVLLNCAVPDAVWTTPVQLTKSEEQSPQQAKLQGSEQLESAMMWSKRLGSLFAKRGKGTIVNAVYEGCPLSNADSDVHDDTQEQNITSMVNSVVKLGAKGFTQYLADQWPDNKVNCSAIVVRSGMQLFDMPNDEDIYTYQREAAPESPWLEEAIGYLLGAESVEVNGQVVEMNQPFTKLEKAL